MNKRFFIAWLLAFVAWFAGSFVVHGLLLHDDYARVQNLFRPEAESMQYFPLMLLAHAIMAGALVWIYSRGVEPAPWLPQAIGFGIAVALLAPVPMYMIYYVVQPMPGGTVVKQIVFDTIIVLIVSALVAFVYRAPERR
jgi:hypothetical protein